MLIKPYYPVTLTIDGEEIMFRIKRMTAEEFSAFADRSARVATPTIARFTSRADSGPEQERDEHGQYRASFEQLCEDRLSTMAADDRERFLAATQADEDEARVFLKEIFEQFVTVEKGITEETADGREVSVTSGLDVLRLFGARRDVLTLVMQAVHAENTLDETVKKAMRNPPLGQDPAADQTVAVN